MDTAPSADNVTFDVHTLEYLTMLACLFKYHSSYWGMVGGVVGFRMQDYDIIRRIKIKIAYNTPTRFSTEEMKMLFRVIDYCCVALIQKRELTAPEEMAFLAVCSEFVRKYKELVWQENTNTISA